MTKVTQYETGNTSDAKTLSNAELTETDLANVAGGNSGVSTRFIEIPGTTASNVAERNAHGFRR